jgi:hypothetical protein
MQRLSRLAEARLRWDSTGANLPTSRTIDMSRQEFGHVPTTGLKHWRMYNVVQCKSAHTFLSDQRPCRLLYSQVGKA